jgi:hypothetical protein
VKALGAAAGGGPGGEAFQVAAVFPGEMEEFAAVEVAGLFAEEGFEAPLDVRAFPGLKAIAAGGEPVELEKVPHGQKVISFKLSVFEESLSFGFAVAVSAEEKPKSHTQHRRVGHPRKKKHGSEDPPLPRARMR